MRPLRTAVLVTTVVAVPAAALAVAVGPAGAHTHPMEAELIEPAVVQVATYGEVSISLIEHAYKGKHIGLFQRTYQYRLATGSGFSVDPSGGVVTSPEVIDVDLGRAKTYAVNKIFRERYPEIAGTLADNEVQQQLRGGDPADRTSERLQQCYRFNTSGASGACVIFAQRIVKVLPYVSSQKKYGNLAAEVLQPKDGQKSDVVVLRVGASSMPAVPLAESVKGRQFTVLGFDADTTPSTRSLRKPFGHFLRDGVTELDRGRSGDDKKPFPDLVNAMASGVAGGPVVGSAAGPGEPDKVIGFLKHRPGGSPSDLQLVGPDAIRAALEKAEIPPRTGPTDATYEAALHSYKNALYKQSIPALTQTLEFYPGHALANEALAVAQRKQGTTEDKTGRTSSESETQAGRDADFWPRTLALAAAATALILLAVAIVLLVRRRRISGAAAAGPPASPTRPVVMHAAPRSSARTDAGPPRSQPTVLRPRPLAAGRYATSSGAADTAVACPVCGSPATPAQAFCARCGQQLR